MTMQSASLSDASPDLAAGRKSHMRRNANLLQQYGYFRSRRLIVALGFWRGLLPSTCHEGGATRWISRVTCGIQLE